MGTVKVNTWYEAVITIDNSLGYRLAVWERDDPRWKFERVYAAADLGWSEYNDWTFYNQVKIGVVDLDFYDE